MTELVQVITTVDSREVAQRIAESIVSKRLAAGVQVFGPINSMYWWNGSIQTAEEWKCVMKTRADLFPDIEQAVTALHPYDVPELLAVPVLAGAASYLEWLTRETMQQPT